MMYETEGRKLKSTHTVLRQEDPDHFNRLEKDLAALIFQGLSSEKFWDLFVQCTKCKFVIPRHYFPYQHECASRPSAARGHLRFKSALRLL